MILISVVRDYTMYKRVVSNNSFLNNDDIQLKDFDNRKENIGISERYNQFLNQYDFSKPSWFIFCHEDWEILECPIKRTASLSKESLYGVFGAHGKWRDNSFNTQFIGHIYDRAKNGKQLRKIGQPYSAPALVDTLDCQALVVHSSIIKKHFLRFDEELEWDFYIESFCLDALIQHKVQAYVTDIDCCHWSQLESPHLRPDCLNKLPYMNDKYANWTFASLTATIGGGRKEIDRQEHMSLKQSIQKTKTSPKQSALNELMIRANMLKQHS